METILAKDFQYRESRIMQGKLIPYRPIFLLPVTQPVQKMIVSYRFKYREVPDYTGCTGENRTFRPKIEIRTVPKKKKKNCINDLHCHPPVTNPAPITHFQLLLPPLLLHLCPSIIVATSSPCPSLNVLSSLYTFIIFTFF